MESGQKCLGHFRFSAGRQKLLYHGCVPVNGGPHERRVAAACLRVRLCARREQNSNDIALADGCRSHQRSAVIVCARIRVNTQAQQQPNLGHVACLRGPHKGGIAPKGARHGDGNSKKQKPADRPLSPAQKCGQSC